MIKFTKYKINHKSHKLFGLKEVKEPVLLMISQCQKISQDSKSMKEAILENYDVFNLLILSLMLYLFLDFFISIILEMTYFFIKELLT